MRLRHTPVALLVVIVALLLLVTQACRRTVQPQTWLEYRRSGGIMGINDRLIIYADGTCTVERWGEAERCVLSREEMEALRRLVDAAMRGRVPPPPRSGPTA